MVVFKKNKLKSDYGKVKKGIGSVVSTIKEDRKKLAKWNKERQAKQLENIKLQQKTLREKVKLEREKRKLQAMRSGGPIKEVTYSQPKKKGKKKKRKTVRRVRTISSPRSRDPGDIFGGVL